MPATKDTDLANSNVVEGQLLLDSFTTFLKKNSPFPSLEMDAIYNVAVQVYDQGKLQEASRFFGMLNLLDPLNPLYLAAQGKCLKRLGAYQDASELFRLAWEADKELPELALHSAECLMLSKRPEEAVSLITLALKTTAMRSHDKNQKLKEKAEAWLSLLKVASPHE